MQTPQIAPPPPPSPPAELVTSVQAPLATPVVPSVSFLLSRGAELSRQLNSANSRREELTRDLRRTSGDAKAGLQTRITVLDERLVQLEKDIAENGRQLASVGGRGAEDASTTQAVSGPMGLGASNITAISVVFTIFVMFPIALAMARLLWKRGTRIGKAPSANPESELRLERVEQGVDAIAIEIERISEGQRFVTQLMTHGDKVGSLGAGQPVADPLHVQLNNTVMAGMPRSDAIR
ncbi:MAG: hypothetical protein H7Z40_01575 [Phycisphaerae bacterium]|nr:hypothetical protein [Gemmatimonadaceae bacterium]